MGKLVGSGVLMEGEGQSIHSGFMKKEKYGFKEITAVARSSTKRRRRASTVVLNYV